MQFLVCALAALQVLNPLFLYLQNPEDKYGGFGFGAVISPIIVLLSLRRMARLIAERPSVRILVLFPLCLLPGTLVSGAPLSLMVSYLGQWVGYAALALAVAAWMDRIDVARALFWALTPITAVLLGLSLVKFYFHVPIPYLNELGGAGGVVVDGVTVWGMLGPFFDRTQAAMVLEGMWAFLLGYVGVTRQSGERRLGMIGLLIVGVFMFHTTNRSFFLMASVLVAVVLTSIRWLSPRNLTRWLPLLSALVAAGLLVAWLLPDHVNYYVQRMLTSWSQKDFNFSEETRLSLWRVAIDTFLGGSILGAGPYGIPVPAQFLGAEDILGYRADPHSSYFFLLWRAGIFGILWLLAFTVIAFRRLWRYWGTPHRPRVLMMFLPVLGSLYIGGLAHTTLPEKMLWVYLGMFLGATFISRQHAPDASR